MHLRSNVRSIIAGIGLAGLAVAGPAAAQEYDYRVDVINDTGTTIEYFYFSSCRTNRWGPDRLGSSETIPPGGVRRFDMYDGIGNCCRDMRAKFVNGASRTRMGVNVCRETRWVVRY
jgi:hypothetical protein